MAEVKAMQPLDSTLTYYGADHAGAGPGITSHEHGSGHKACYWVLVVLHQAAS